MSGHSFEDLAVYLEGEAPAFIAEIRTLFEGTDDEGREEMLKFTREGGIAKLDAAKAAWERRRDSQ